MLETSYNIHTESELTASNCTFNGTSRRYLTITLGTILPSVGYSDIFPLCV